MPALITEVINPQGFEIVRDAIGAILKLELDNQKALQSFTEPVNVYSERDAPMSESEELYFNVLLDSATYGEKTQQDVQGRTVYFIDIYTTGQNKADGTPGEQDSGTRIGKFLGMVRYILSSTKYNRLGFAAGLIGGTMVESFATGPVDAAQSGSYNKAGRITFSVRIQESQAMWEGVTWQGSDTTVKLAQTELGYQYILDAE